MAPCSEVARYIYISALPSARPGGSMHGRLYLVHKLSDSREDELWGAAAQVHCAPSPTPAHARRGVYRPGPIYTNMAYLARRLNLICSCC